MNFTHLFLSALLSQRQTDPIFLARRFTQRVVPLARIAVLNPVALIASTAATIPCASVYTPIYTAMRPAASPTTLEATFPVLELLFFFGFIFVDPFRFSDSGPQIILNSAGAYVLT